MKSYFFIITVVLITCRPLLPVIDYLVNYEKIVTELCINRDRPELNCNGVCYLTNEVSKSAESQQKEKNTTSIKAIDYFVYETVLEVKNPFLEKVIKVKYNSRNEDLPQYHLSNIFHPPIA